MLLQYSPCDKIRESTMSSAKGISDATTPVLIVDDNPQFALVLRRILSGVFGYSNITSVESTEEAYSLLREASQNFALLFIDFRFPSGKTGVQLLEQLAAEGLLAGKAAFLITSEPNLDNFKSATTAGAVGVVAKPFDREDLRRQLEKADRFLKVDEVESF